MDGKGRALDNVIVERFWRSVKYEEVYLRDYASMSEARKGLERYFRFYNHERPHSSLGWRTPAETYFDRREAEGESRFAPAAATPVALPTRTGRAAPSVAAAVPSTIHLKSEQNWS
jgi:putative transposase